ncbi:MAG: HupE/UreJ family protein [Pseudomonadota bacterium]
MLSSFSARIILLVSVFSSILCSSLQAHPQDEDIILDIEQGVMSLDTETLKRERIAAEKRKQQRQLNALPTQQKFLKYIEAGIEHIVPKGLDHILFVVGLFFSTLSIKRLLLFVTAFTGAHTATLGLAALGWVSVPGWIVEPLIALSIAYVALENLLSKEPSRSRIYWIFGFGLLHGLGFASVLVDYGLPQNAMILALVAFNIGVEIGQLLIILSLLVVFYGFRTSRYYRRCIQIPISVIIGLAGSYWFIERVFLS